MTARTAILGVQVATYAGLGLLFVRAGLYKLATAQFLLAVAQWVVFS